MSGSFGRGGSEEEAVVTGEVVDGGDAGEAEGGEARGEGGGLAGADFEGGEGVGEEV